MLDTVKERIEDYVPELRHRVEGGASFAALMQSGHRPQSPVQAYVLYAGVAARGTPPLGAGYFAQNIRESINVVLMVNSSAPEAQRALDLLRPINDAILQALCGWAPGDEVGVFELVRAEVVSFQKSLLIWNIDLAINDQLRIHR
ncbi:MAG: hypothetical protein AAF755_10345 [Pseudomonadota bacterium]